MEQIKKKLVASVIDMRNACGTLLGKPIGRCLLGRQIWIWEYSIKKGLMEMFCYYGLGSGCKGCRLGVVFNFCDIRTGTYSFSYFNMFSGNIE